MIGAFFGFLIFGPIGAIFGLLIGNFFDHGLVEHFANPFWHFDNEKDVAVKGQFFESLFCIIGHIAKSNGQVDKLDIQNTNRIIEQMRLNTKNKKLAQHYFGVGKAKEFDLFANLGKLQKAINKNPNLIRLFINTIYNFIKVSGVTIEKLDILNNVLSSLGMAPIQRQTNFNDEYSWYETRQREYRSHSYNHQQQQESSQKSYRRPWQNSFNIDEYYTILGVPPTATKDQVKRAYRKLISRNHPDKLIAKGLSEQEIKKANEKTSRISRAYDEICKYRGW